MWQHRDLEKIPTKAIAAFASSYEIDAATGCWNWTKRKMNKGYGIIIAGKLSYRAHRVSYFLHNNADPKELFVCHSCDNPACVNPDHLWLGNNADNMADKLSKNRQWRAPVSPDGILLCGKCGHRRTDDYVRKRFGRIGSYRVCRNCSRLNNIRRWPSRKKG